MRQIAQDPDDLYGDAVVAEIKIQVRRNGSMATAGDIGDLAFALAMLDHAKDAVRQHHMRLLAGKHVIISSEDVTLPEDRKVLLPA